MFNPSIDGTKSRGEVNSKKLNVFNTFFFKIVSLKVFPY
jgi:hypothetical protein